jgi:aminopeptidase N
LEAGRRAHAERALKRVAAVEHLSPDTRDIVTRTLA